MLDNDSLAATFAQPPCSGLEALETLSGRPFFRLTQLKLAARALLKHGPADARDCVCRRSSAQGELLALNCRIGMRAFTLY